MQPRYYLGVDGGQSSTVALIANEDGRVLGRGKSGPCNHASAAEGRTKFLSAMNGCLQEACDQAGLNWTDTTFASVCLGFSGGPEDKDQYARELIRSAQYKITHDAEIALSGAMPDEAGIIAIAGTGSMIFGRNHRGETARAGGWGYIYGSVPNASGGFRRGECESTPAQVLRGFSALHDCVLCAACHSRRGGWRHSSASHSA